MLNLPPVLKKDAAHTVFAVMLVTGALVSILTPYRVVPIPNFLPEVAAALFLFAGAAVLAARAPAQVRIGMATAACLLLATWIYLGMRVHQPPYADILVWPLGSLLAAAAAAHAGLSFRLNSHEHHVAAALAALWILASLGTCALQWFQLLNPDQLRVWAVPRSVDMQPFGNLAQRNHAAGVHALAILSLAWAAGRWPRAWVRVLAGAAAVSALMGLAMTGSRIGTILGVLTAAVGPFLLVHDFAGQSRKRQWTTVCACAVAFAALYFAVQQWLFTFPTLQQTYSAGTRWTTFSNVSRISLFIQSWDIFREYPLFGAGWGSFSKQSLERVDELLHPQFAGHAHNLIANLAAEAGVVGLALVLGPLAWIGRSALRTRLEAPRLYLGAMVVLLLVYSMTEFPLWHTFFLIPFAFALGAIDDPIASFRTSRPLRALLAILFALLVAGSVLAMVRYIQVSRQVATVFQIGAIPPEVRESIRRSLDSPGFSQQTELLAFGLLPVDSANLAAKIALGDRVIAGHIDAFLLQKQASLLALDGQVERAATLLVVACRFYPDRCPKVVERMHRFVALEPATFEPVMRRFKEKAAADPRVPPLQEG